MTAIAPAPLAVRKTVTVNAPQALAFEVFTARIEAWWPMASHHIGEAACAAVVMEPRAGGRWYERGVNGVECDWGRVIAWNPPEHVQLDWQLTAQWAFDPDFHTDIEVRFVAVDARTTRVELAHRGLEAFGTLAGQMHETFSSPQGWGGMLEHYAAVAAAQVGA